MKKCIVKTVVITLIAITTVVMSGCYGSFKLTSELHRWNGSVSNSKFVKELVFLGLIIIPAYELACLGDAIIFNTIEFWGGQNPIAMKVGEVEEVDVLRDGQLYKLIKSRNSLVVVNHDNTSRIEFKYFPKEKSWYMMEGENKVKVVEMKDNTVFTYLPNQRTLTFDKNSIDRIEAEVMANR